MRYKEYGKENRDAMILLHGGGLSWWNYREVAQALQGEYRVILPILDGHAESDRDFTTIADNAAEIIRFIDEELDGSVLLIGGLSLGGQVLAEMLCQRKDICRFALIESALVIPSRLTAALIPPAFGSCYGLIAQKWFSRLQFYSLRIKPALFADYYRDTCAITKQNMIAFLRQNAVYTPKEALADCRAQTHIYVGAKENRSMRRSAQKIQQMLPGSTLHTLPGLYHGEFSINHGDRYAQTLRAIVAGQ